MARLLMKMENYSEAEKHWRAVRAMNPENLAGFVGLAEVFLKKNQADQFANIIRLAGGDANSNEYIPYMRLKSIALKKGYVDEM